MTTSKNVLPPFTLELRGDLESNWQFFKEQWVGYITATESAGKDKSIKASLLRTVMGRDCIKVN